MTHSTLRQKPARMATSLFAVLAVLAVLVVAPVARAQTTPAPAPARATRPAVTTAGDTGWPRSYASSEGTVLFYQPQLDDYAGTKFEAHAAVAIERPDPALGPLYGVIWFSSDTEVDKELRTVTFLNLTITKVSFPSQPENADRYMTALQKVVPARTRTIALDRLEALLAAKTGGKAPSARDLKNEPPRIVFAEVPTLHVPIDGTPVLRPVGSEGLDRVLNTRQVILFDKQKNTYYLHLFDGWMSASSLDGPWSVAEKAKAADKTLDAVLQSTNVDLLDGVSPESVGEAAAPPPSLKSGQVPALLVTSTPTELVVTDGKANFVPITGTQLLYVSNTTSNVFRNLTDQNMYVLLSGRWFKGSGADGGWTYVPGKQLPPDFAAIPDDSPKENVKASVPGTAQAKEALIANEIPQTATVRRSGTSLPAIVYDGAPKFVPIQGTSLSYAVNAGTPVIMVDEVSYYACGNAVWFVSASPNGPWAVADQVPAAIYEIPPSSPLYYVTYVKIYNSNADEVQVGYTPGYYGAVEEDDDDDGEPDVVIMGTGWDCDPWIGAYWWGCPYGWGWGYGMAWTPWCGWCWGWGGYWGWNSIGGVGWGWATGPFGGAVAWGPGGWIGSTGNVYNRWGNRSVVSRTSAGYNRTNGNYFTRELGASYNSRTGRLAAGQKATVGNVFSGNSVTAGKGVVYNPNNGNMTRVAGIKGENAGAAKIGNQVFAGKDGQVYRKTDSGWQEVGRGDRPQPKSEWKDVGNGDRKNRDSVQSLDKERKARDAGDKRAKDYRSYDRGKTVDRGRVSSPSRSYGGSRGGFGGRGGGGFRGGGGRRR